MAVDNKSVIQKQDRKTLISGVSANKICRDLTWNWLRGNWPKIYKYYYLSGDLSSAETLVETCASSFNKEFELKELEHCQNQFAHFLKRWAISPYNKQALTLLNFVMNKENDKDRSALVSKSLKAQEETVKILEEEMNNLPEGVTSLESSEIKEKVEQLLCLKHSGKYLKDALAAVTASLNGSIGYADVEVSREIHSITLDEWISKHSTDLKSKH